MDVLVSIIDELNKTLPKYRFVEKKGNPRLELTYLDFPAGSVALDPDKIKDVEYFHQRAEILFDSFLKDLFDKRQDLTVPEDVWP